MGEAKFTNTILLDAIASFKSSASAPVSRAARKACEFSMRSNLELAQAISSA